MDQLIKEMENMRIQFQDMKKEMEYVKGQLKDTKTELNETKIQLEESKIQREETKTKISDLGKTLKNIEELGKTNTKDILANSKMMKRVLERFEYAKNPCTNCYGPVYCLDGKEVGTRPRIGTQIRTKDGWYCGKDKDGQYVRGATGLVYENKIDWDLVRYEPAGSKRSTYDDKDFRKFVYYCPKWA